MKLLAAFLVTSLAYTLLYAAYAFSARTAAGRVMYVAAVVSGTLLGSTLGNRWFR